MITGRQIREARKLLGMSAPTLAERAHMCLAAVERAEASDGEASLSSERLARLQLVLERCGVEFAEASEGGAGVRLRTAAKP